MKRFQLLLVLCMAACACTRAGASGEAGPVPLPVAGASTGQGAEIDRLVDALCDQHIVLLGEADHGDGRSWEIKSAIVRELVASCGFNAVAFESGMYDFLALETVYQAGVATRADLADAIGAIWSGARQLQPLISDLHSWSSSGSVRVLGIDDQIHSTARFAQRSLPGALSAHLSDPRSASCEAELARHTSWGYDDAHPWGEQANDRLLACLDEIVAALQSRLRSPRLFGELAMAGSLHRFLSRSFVTDAAARFNARDASMFQNLRWHLDRLGPETRVIVWTATIHAARSLAPVASYHDWIPLGHHLRGHYREQVASIGFSAASGGSQPRGRPGKVLDVAPQESLEGRVLAPAQQLRYLDVRELSGLGVIAARPLGHQFHRANWDQVLDGLVVLRHEAAAIHD